MLQQRREQFHRGLQREERERLFHRIRLQLLSGESLMGAATEEKQDEILESIAYFKSQQQPLDFAAINNYCYEFQGPFRPQLIEQLIPIALEKHPSNAQALACAANLLSKCRTVEVIDRMDLRKVVRELLQTNLVEGKEQRASGKALAFLLQQLIAISGDKQAFAELPQYYPHIIKSVGQFDIVTLLLLAEGSICRMLLPPPSVINSYLLQEIPYQALDHFGVYKLLEFISNCLRFNQNEQHYQAASQWIDWGLKSARFPLGLKPELIRLMTMMIRERNSSFFIDFVEKLTVFREIMYQARFGAFGTKEPALQFVATLVMAASPEILRHCVEEHQLMEVMVFSLQLSLEKELALKMLNGLAKILKANTFLVNKAHLLSLHYYLQRYNDPHFDQSIIEAASVLQGIMSHR